MRLHHRSLRLVRFFLSVFQSIHQEGITSSPINPSHLTLTMSLYCTKIWHFVLFMVQINTIKKDHYVKTTAIKPQSRILSLVIESQFTDSLPIWWRISIWLNFAPSWCKIYDTSRCLVKEKGLKRSHHWHFDILWYNSSSVSLLMEEQTSLFDIYDPKTTD